jgi:hypothetical protein
MNKAAKALAPLYARFTAMPPEKLAAIRRPWPSASACS